MHPGLEEFCPAVLWSPDHQYGLSVFSPLGTKDCGDVSISVISQQIYVLCSHHGSAQDESLPL